MPDSAWAGSSYAHRDTTSPSKSASCFLDLFSVVGDGERWVSPDDTPDGASTLAPQKARRKRLSQLPCPPSVLDSNGSTAYGGREGSDNRCDLGDR